MKTLFYFIALAIMIWALIDQVSEKPSIWLQGAAVVFFFGAMMQLMNRTPSNKSKDEVTKSDDDE